MALSNSLSNFGESVKPMATGNMAKVALLLQWTFMALSNSLHLAEPTIAGSAMPTEIGNMAKVGNALLPLSSLSSDGLSVVSMLQTVIVSTANASAGFHC